MLFVLALACAPVQTAAPPLSAPADETDEGAGLFGLEWDEVFPLSASEPQHPVTVENASALYWTSCLLGVYAGPLWIPQTVTGVAPGPGYSQKALAIWFLHALPLVLLPLSIVPILGCGVTALLIADLAYWMPLAIESAYDQSLLEIQTSPQGANVQRH